MATKLLVVDDEPDVESLVRMKFRRQIRENLYDFVFARGGTDALAKLVDHPDVCVVLSDINMPDMDGLTLLQKIMEMKNPFLKTVVVSAYGDMKNIRTAMNRGAFDFVTKPIDFVDLEATITKTLLHVDATKRALEEHDQLVSVHRDLSIATRIQQSIIPHTFPPFPERHEVDIYAEMMTAKEVGGDFYDFFFIDNNRLAFVIGDVSGKGVPAAIFMAMSRTLLKAVAFHIPDPARCLAKVNNLLFAENDTSMFVTVFFAILNTSTGELEYSNGGHNSPYVLRTDGTMEQLEAVGGLFLGAMGELTYESKKIALTPGDILFLYTDGVTEAMDGQQMLFGEQRLQDFLLRFKTSSISDLIRSSFAELQGFSEGSPQADDITILALRYRGTDSA